MLENHRLQCAAEQMLLVATWAALRLATTLLKHGKLEIPPCFTLILDYDFQNLSLHQLQQFTSRDFALWGSCSKLRDVPLSFQSRTALIPPSNLRPGPKIKMTLWPFWRHPLPRATKRAQKWNIISPLFAKSTGATGDHWRLFIL